MEEKNSLSMQELTEQIGAHIEVIDLENPILPNALEGFEATGPLPNPVPPILKEVLHVPPTIKQDAAS